MANVDQETCSLTLRRVSRCTSDNLYRAKMVTGKPICLLADEIVAFYFQHHPHLLQTTEDMLNGIQLDLKKIAEQCGAELRKYIKSKCPESDRPSDPN